MVNVQHQGQSYNSSIDARVWNETLLPFIQEFSAISQEVKSAFLQMNAAFDNKAIQVAETKKISLLEPLLVTESGAGAELTQKEQDGSIIYITELALINHQEPNKIEEVAISENKNDDSDDTQEPILTGATHLMQAGIAVPIEHCKLSIQGQQLKLDTHAKGNAQSLLAAGKLFVMGDESCKEFRPNDRIGSHLAEGVVTVIQVV